MRLRQRDPDLLSREPLLVVALQAGPLLEKALRPAGRDRQRTGDCDRTHDQEQDRQPASAAASEGRDREQDDHAKQGVEPGRARERQEDRDRQQDKDGDLEDRPQAQEPRVQRVVEEVSNAGTMKGPNTFGSAKKASARVSR